MIVLFRHSSELTPYLLHTIQAMGNGCGDAIENLCRNMCNRLPTINLGYTWVGVLQFMARIKHAKMSHLDMIYIALHLDVTMRNSGRGSIVNFATIVSL